VPLIGYCTNGPQYCLVYEYLQRGSLLEAIACVVSAHQSSFDLVKLFYYMKCLKYLERVYVRFF
jgi:hypothetical protein